MKPPFVVKDVGHADLSLEENLVYAFKYNGMRVVWDPIERLFLSKGLKVCATIPQTFLDKIPQVKEEHRSHWKVDGELISTKFSARKLEGVSEIANAQLNSQQGHERIVSITRKRECDANEWDEHVVFIPFDVYADNNDNDRHSMLHEVPLVDRLVILGDLWDHLLEDHHHVVRPVEYFPYDHVKNKEYMKEALMLGHEGIVVRRLGLKYRHPDSMRKIRNFYEGEATIENVEEKSRMVFAYCRDKDGSPLSVRIAQGCFKNSKRPFLSGDVIRFKFYNASSTGKYMNAIYLRHSHQPGGTIKT